MTSLATNGTLTSVVWHPCRHALQKSGHAASASLIFIGVCDKMRLCGTMTITVCLSFLPQRCLTRSSFRPPIDVSRHPRRDATTRTRRRVVCRLVSHTLATLARALHVDLLNCQLLVVAHTHPIFLDTTQSDHPPTSHLNSLPRFPAKENVEPTNARLDGCVPSLLASCGMLNLAHRRG